MKPIDPPKSGDKRDVQIQERIGKAGIVVNGFGVSNLPPASQWGGTDFSSIIFVHDETGGAVLAFSDGTSWRRVTDRAVVS